MSSSLDPTNVDPDDLIGVDVHLERLERTARIRCPRTAAGIAADPRGAPTVNRGSACWLMSPAFWCDNCLELFAEILEIRLAARRRRLDR